VHNIGKHNHPLYSVDEHPSNQRVIEKYHFNHEQSFSSLGQLTKETLLDTWDHETIDLADLSYINGIEGGSDIYFIVLSKEKGDVNEKENVKDKYVESESNSSVSAEGNLKENKEQISVYFLCVPVCIRRCITKEIFSHHIDMVNFSLQNKTHLPKLKTISTPLIP
jgi:hypothetical protein